MIEVKNLSKSFNGKIAVDNISFIVGEGETFVLLGTSGCGKTSTLRMINCLVEPTSGEIKINGKNIREKRPEDLRKQIGYVIQSVGLFPHYTVEENIAVVPKLLNWNRKEISNRVYSLMEMIGLPPNEFVKRYPHELSGGEKQRVGLARALAADPPVVLLDEPFGALDPITRRQIRKEFITLESLLKKTMVLVTHDVFEAFELGEKICIMDNGKIQQIGTQKELLFNPANLFVKTFFEADKKYLEQIIK